MNVKVGILQSFVTMDKEKNIKEVVRSIDRMASNGAQIIVLPEMFYCPYNNAYFRQLAEYEDGDCVHQLSAAALRNHVYLVAGSIPELDPTDHEKVYNTCFIFDDEGAQIARHRKMHLFDIDVRGGQRFRESDTFTPGDTFTVFDTPWGRMGAVICFDYRFPELARLTAQSGAKVIFIPAAFNMTTGPAHWEIMHRVRSLDNQIYSIAAAPARDEQGVYVSYANSMAVSPWGDILWRAGTNATEGIVDLDLDAVDDIRGQLPLVSQRRTDLYEIVWKPDC